MQPYKFLGEYKQIGFFYENFGFYALLDITISKNAKNIIDNIKTIKPYRTNKKKDKLVLSYKIEKDKNYEKTIKKYINTILRDINGVK